jgi:hypothetical protein
MHRSNVCRNRVRSRVGTKGHLRNDWNTLPEDVVPIGTFSDW